jgi:hypothetical protein
MRTARPLLSLPAAISRESLRLRCEIALFIIASAMDSLMTLILLKSHSPGDGLEFVESNPVACCILDDWGFPGLFGFKLVMVGLITTVCAMIAVRRIDVARHVLRFGVVTASLVVVYAAVLAIRNG